MVKIKSLNHSFILVYISANDQVSENVYNVLCYRNMIPNKSLLREKVLN